MLDQLRKGDVVTVWKLDRLARSTLNLLKIVETDRNAGDRFQSIPHHQTSRLNSHHGRLLVPPF